MAFSRALGNRSLADGIRVVGVNPGPVETDRLTSVFEAQARQRLGDESRYRELIVKFPMGRAASPREIADAIVSSRRTFVVHEQSHLDDRRRLLCATGLSTPSACQDLGAAAFCALCVA